MTATDNKAQVTGGQAMARQLAAEGVEYIFGIPGVQLDYASNGLAGYTDQIQFINARHEQTTTYAADGYARTTGKIGVALVVPGPGVLNAGSGLVTALACSSKVLLISGQIPTRGIGRRLWVAPRDPRPVRASWRRYVARRRSSPIQARWPGALHGAMVQLQNGPGPVAVEIPPDILKGVTDGAAIGAEPAGTPSAGSDADLGAPPNSSAQPNDPSSSSAVAGPQPVPGTS